MCIPVIFSYPDGDTVSGVAVDGLSMYVDADGICQISEIARPITGTETASLLGIGKTLLSGIVASGELAVREDGLFDLDDVLDYRVLYQWKRHAALYNLKQRTR